MLKMMLPGLLWLAFWITAAAGVGLAWEAWQRHDYRECSKSPECRAQRKEAQRHVADDIPDHANQNYYRD